MRFLITRIVHECVVISLLLSVYFNGHDFPCHYFIIRFMEWDNQFFGIGDIEAKQIDPQQHFVLECTHMAMEDGGITKRSVDGTNTGVYIGICFHYYIFRDLIHVLIFALLCIFSLLPLYIRIMLHFFLSYIFL